MVAKVVLFSEKEAEINRFLSSFYDNTLDICNKLSWQKEFSNPIEISEIIAAFIDNINDFDINMWITLDRNVFINISSSNADIIIKYLFERYPY